MGYWVDRQIIDAADFGVPQHRVRLVLRAVRGGFPPSLPAKEKKRGWYEAIADLIPTLEPSQLAPWQIKRLPPNLLSDFLMDSKNVDPQRTSVIRFADRAADTVRASGCRGFPKAVIVERTGVRAEKLKFRWAEEPAWTIRSSITTDGQGNNRSRFIDAILPGQVLQLNIHTLARLQSFPDWYVFRRCCINGMR
ncbi:DNA cytosine methyltransferase [Chroococcidiopsis sp. FACHB-1243]|uniref:DNA cytosine methyltransferase n=1 Tax=Chroococcidiopsis sp. [FACHB-1243] TaxID=2692781 RepID=UPI00177F78A2|nr:DNA cytosine methyltransferase [Chroococcidiopsis sp. [FACHB-1243]]MBD2305559.1 DNA cytosine methyltransferase [Chroococcidiopsis sp. [FACHB-1243]]